MLKISGSTSLFARMMPQDCQLCGAAAPATICTACVRDFPFRVTQGCKCCGQVGDVESLEGEICGDCLADPPKFDLTRSAFSYAFPLDKLMQSFKFNANLALLDLFVDYFVSTLKNNSATMPDVIIPMPLARKRLATRGFNQSALLAREIGKKLNVKVESHGLLRVRETPPQAGLNRAARLENMKGAFDCAQNLAGQRIALVDDVMTTGATMSDAARALKKQGAATVDAWAIARASR
jgi:ComF family protein